MKVLSWLSFFVLASMLAATAVAQISQSKNPRLVDVAARPGAAEQVAPLTPAEIREMLEQDPALKQQMQDYAAALRAKGMPKEEVLKAVYRRLNEIHVERVRRARDSGQRNDIEQFQAQDVQPDQARDVKPYAAEDARVRGRRENGADPRNAPERRNGGASIFMHTFGLAVPGVAYSYDNYATNTRTTVAAAGTLTKSSVRINPDHTYDWNSAWDGKLIHGRWTDWNDGGIRLLHGQEGKDWLMQALKAASGKATVILYNDSTQYHGTPLN